MRDSGVDLRAQPGRSTLEQLAAVLLGLADFLVELANALRRWAEELTRTVDRLDELAPGWRDDPRDSRS